ncbi:MAG TPA: zinc-dependent metalloprotease, partial [Polyangiales bacterium]|nr:zinc-dependent metalloprotease [Polyangiales bacterium]
LSANACDLDPNKPCEDLGDIRYHFLTHLQQGGANFGGIAQPLSDPTNGELIATSATIAAETLENVGSLASQFFPVLRGDASEDSYFTGENLRGYFANLGHVEHPVATVPATQGGNVTGDLSRPTRVDDMQTRMNKMFAKAQKLQGNEGRSAIFSDRKAALKGTAIDTQLTAALASELPTPDNDGTNATAVAASDGTPPTTATPTTTSSTFSIDQAQQDLDVERQRRNAMGTRNMDVFDDQLYNSQYWRYYANAFAGRSPAEASLRMQQAQFRGIAIHEIGHVLGLRHNFAGSLDRNNYHDGYFALATRTPLPSYADYDDPAHGGNGDGVVVGDEVQRFESDIQTAREDRLNEGSGTVSTASIMDYNGDLSDYAGLGRYDRAAVMYSYFNKVEAYDTGDPTVDPSQNPNVAPPRAFLGLERPDIYRRELWTYYRGGDACQSDDDCPFRAGREGTAYQVVSQRCVPNPRLPASTAGACANSGDCVCSNFYDDFDAYSGGTAFRSVSRAADYAPVKYLFCHDNRTNDLSWCTPSDAGESFQEVIEHYRRNWRERYPQVYFRNFHAAGPTKGAAYDNVVDAVKIYQHMFFRSNYEGQAYLQDQRPLGFQDQFTASAAALDWLGEIIGAPDVGSYKLDSVDKLYRSVSADTDADGSDLSLPVGQGFYLWSEYQTGLNGYFRLERAGTFLDKLLAIQAITKRDWGLTYQVDEFYYVNFYDAFQQEVVDMFGGLIMRNPRQYAPRVGQDADGNNIVQYISTYRDGDRGNQDETYPAPAIDGTDTETLRDIATIEALSEFPVYYDTSFEQRMLVFKLGSGDGYTIPATRSDGTPTCKYNDANCDQPDYIVYVSDRLHTSYVAVVIDPEETGKIDEQQVAFQLLKRLYDRQTRIHDLTQQSALSDDENTELTRIKADLVRDESFLEYLIQLERQLGISSYFF